MRYSDPTHRKMGIFSHIFAPPPPGGETWEILLANYKGPPMPFHYLYNWLLPLARFRKSRPDKNRYRKKEEEKRESLHLQNIRRCADRPAAYLGGDESASSRLVGTPCAFNLYPSPAHCSLCVCIKSGQCQWNIAQAVTRKPVPHDDDYTPSYIIY